MNTNVKLIVDSEYLFAVMCVSRKGFSSLYEDDRPLAASRQVNGTQTVSLGVWSS